MRKRTEKEKHRDANKKRKNAERKVDRMGNKDDVETKKKGWDSEAMTKWGEEYNGREKQK